MLRLVPDDIRGKMVTMLRDESIRQNRRETPSPVEYTRTQDGAYDKVRYRLMSTKRAELLIVT